MPRRSGWRQVALLDELIANAWPALDFQMLDGWILRLGSRLSLRSNSVLPTQVLGTMSLEQRLELVEDVYASRDLAACYHVSPAAQPPELDELLDRRGYQVLNAHDVMVSRLDGLHLRGTRDGEIVLMQDPDSRWFDVSAAVWGWSDERIEEVSRSMERIRLPTAWALHLRDDEPVAVGRAVLERGWIGIYGMATLPAARGEGAASAIISRLVSWAQAHGASSAYLMVAVDNPAQSLYQHLGFRHSHRYHYRRSS